MSYNQAMSGPTQIESSPHTAPRQRLSERLVKGIAWTGGVKWASQILSWISTIIVARLLTPEDYGLVAMAVTFLGLVSVVNEFGLGSAIVMLQKLPPQLIAQLNSLAVLFGLAGFGIVCLAAFPLGRFYAAVDLPMVVIVLGMGFVIGAFRSVPNALLEKDLSFKTLAFLEGGQGILSAGMAILLAFAGMGYWALVLGNLIGNAASTIVVLTQFARPFGWPRFNELAGVLRFSWHLLATRVSWYFATSSDIFVTGRLLGQSVLGVYSFGATLANIPLEKVTALVNRVAPAFYSTVQNDQERLQRFLMRLTEGLALITVPAALGMAMVSEEFVLLVLGEKWEGVAGPLQVLAFYAAFRSVTSLMSPLLFLTGGSRLGMWNALVAGVLFPIGFLIGCQWGAVGVAVAWLVVHPLSMVPVYRHVLPRINLSFARYAQTLWPAGSSALIMMMGVFLMRMNMPPDASLIARLGILVCVGSATYLFTLVALHRPRVVFFLTTVRNGFA